MAQGWGIGEPESLPVPGDPPQEVGKPHGHHLIFWRRIRKRGKLSGSKGQGGGNHPLLHAVKGPPEEKLLSFLLPKKGASPGGADEGGGGEIPGRGEIRKRTALGEPLRQGGRGEGIEEELPERRKGAYRQHQPLLLPTYSSYPLAEGLPAPGVAKKYPRPEFTPLHPHFPGGGANEDPHSPSPHLPLRFFSLLREEAGVIGAEEGPPPAGEEAGHPGEQHLRLLPPPGEHQAVEALLQHEVPGQEGGEMGLFPRRGAEGEEVTGGNRGSALRDHQRRSAEKPAEKPPGIAHRGRGAEKPHLGREGLYFLCQSGQGGTAETLVEVEFVHQKKGGPGEKRPPLFEVPAEHLRVGEDGPGPKRHPPLPRGGLSVQGQRPSQTQFLKHPLQLPGLLPGQGFGGEKEKGGGRGVLRQVLKEGEKEGPALTRGGGGGQEKMSAPAHREVSFKLMVVKRPYPPPEQGLAEGRQEILREGDQPGRPGGKKEVLPDHLPQLEPVDEPLHHLFHRLHFSPAGSRLGGWRRDGAEGRKDSAEGRGLGARRGDFEVFARWGAEEFLFPELPFRELLAGGGRLPLATRRSVEERRAGLRKREFCLEGLSLWLERLGAPEESLGNAARLEAGAPCVVAGQQPGLLLGPLYTLWKAWGVCAYTSFLSSLLGERVIPVFWVGSDDHDSSEFARSLLVDRKGGLRLLSMGGVPPGAPAGEVPVGRRFWSLLQEVGDLSRGKWPSGPGRVEEAIRVVEEAASRAGTLPDLFTSLLLRLFGSRGLVPVDPRLPSLRRTASSLLVQALEDPREGGRLLVYWHRRGKRVALFRRGREILTREGEVLGGADDFRKHLERHPEEFSPHGRLRPVAEARMLPVIVHLAGPGEVSYLSDCREEFSRYGENLYPLIPRPSLTLAREAYRGILGLPSSPEAARTALRQAEERLRESPRSRVEGERREWEARWQSLLQWGDGIFGPRPELGPVWDKSRRRLEREKERLERKWEDSLIGEERQSLALLREAGNVLFPLGHPQERILCSFQWILWLGWEGMREVLEGLPLPLEHGLVYV